MKSNWCYGIAHVMLTTNEFLIPIVKTNGCCVSGLDHKSTDVRDIDWVYISCTKLLDFCV